VIIDKDNKPWFKGRDIALILEYIKTADALSTHVNNKYKKSYKDLDSVNHGVPIKVDPKTIFINQTGLIQLIGHSKMPKAIAFYEWIAEDVIPEILTTGSYTMPSPKADIARLNKSFYDDNMLSSYENKHVVYLGYIGEHNKKHTLKIGESGDFPTRDLIAHRKTYGKFIVIQIWEVMANHQAEQKIKMNFKSKNMLTQLKFKGKNRTELVALNGINDLDYCIRMMTQVINATKSHVEINYEHKIDLLRKDLDHSIQMSKADHKLLEQKDETITQLKLLVSKLQS
jgi:prophage antirepressor-like protein